MAGDKRGRPTKEDFTPTTQIIADLQAGKTTKQVADACGITVAAVQARCRAAGFSVKAVRGYAARKADLFAWKQQQIIESMTPAKIEAASLRDMATTLNILHNAERLERGQSTENLSFADMSREMHELEQEECRLRNILAATTTAKLPTG